jgi:hypothetical protein
LGEVERDVRLVDGLEVNLTVVQAIVQEGVGIDCQSKCCTPDWQVDINGG